MNINQNLSPKTVCAFLARQTTQRKRLAAKKSATRFKRVGVFRIDPLALNHRPELILPEQDSPNRHALSRTAAFSRTACAVCQNRAIAMTVAAGCECPPRFAVFVNLVS